MIINFGRKVRGTFTRNSTWRWSTSESRHITADTHSDHAPMCKFRRENIEAVAGSFLQVPLLAREPKLLHVRTVRVDGTKVDANASTHRSVRYDRAKALAEQLQADVAELFAQAERADATDSTDAQSLPEELSRREARVAQLDEACKRLESQAKVRAQSERAEYECKVAARSERSGRRKGKRPKPPDATPESGEQTNLSDPDSGLMRKSKRHTYRQSYTAQAVVDSEGAQLVLGTRVGRNASDRNELVAEVESIPTGLGVPETVLADDGFAPQGAVERREGMEARVAMGGPGPATALRLSPAQGVQRHDADPQPLGAGDASQARLRDGSRPVSAAPIDGGAGVRRYQRTYSDPLDSSGAGTPRSRASGNWSVWPPTASDCTGSSPRAPPVGGGKRDAAVSRPQKPLIASGATSAACFRRRRAPESLR